MEHLSPNEPPIAPPDKGLRASALGFASSFLMTISSCGPALALAVVIGSLVSVAGVNTPGVILLGVVPVLLTVICFAELNAVQPDCGTTFVWVGRSLGPSLGFLSGWGLLCAGLVNMPAATYIGSTYLLSMFGFDDQTENTPLIVGIGVAITIALTAACYFGVEIAARLQQILVVIEVVLVVLLLVVAIWKVATGDVLDSHASPSWEWINPFHIEAGALSAGVVLVIFGFWGWDIAFSLSEETEGAARTPVRATFTTMAALIVIYVVGAVAFLAFAGPDFITENGDTLMNAIGESVLGSWAAKLLVLCVFTSVVAATQTTIISSSRQLLAMGVYKALPRRFATMNRYKSPGFSTILVGAISALTLVVLSALSTDVLFDSLSATGLLIAFYYALTAAACFWAFRSTLTSSIRNLVLRGVVPVTAVVAMGFAFYETAAQYLDPANSTSSVLGMGTIFVLSIGLLTLGLVALAILRFRQRAFFAGGTMDVDAPTELADPTRPA